jgi:hypothetical protein
VVFINEKLKIVRKMVKETIIPGAKGLRRWGMKH